MAVPGDLLDLVLIGMTLMFAASGYRHGFIVGLLSLVGFFGGVVAGAQIGPPIAQFFTSSSSWRALLAILIVFIIAVTGMLLASRLGAALRMRVSGRQVTRVDSLAGAVMSALAVIVIVWLIGAFAANSPQSGFHRQVTGSALLSTLDRLVPPTALSNSPTLRHLVNVGRYTAMFDALSGGTTGLRPTSAHVAPSAAVSRDERSVVEIIGPTRSCTPGQLHNIEGSGFVIGPEHVLTNAHVVAGLTQQPKVITQDHHSYRARVVLYDSSLDVAVLYVPRLHAQALPLADGLASLNASAIMAGYPEVAGRPVTRLTLSNARIGHRISPSILGMQRIAGVRLNVYTIRADVQPGNSGSPLLSSDGRVYGVVFAASTAGTETGYALTAPEIRSDADKGAHAIRSAPTPGSPSC